jgi:hypothetical protein
MLNAARTMSSALARLTPLATLLLLGACATSSEEARSPADVEGAGASEAEPAELTPGEVVIKLRGNETDIRRCFFANPSARGSLSLSWLVNGDGRIEQLKRERSTLDDPRIAECLAEKLYDVRFDPRPEPARARWTFVFRLVEAPRSGSKHRSPNKRDRDRREASEQGVQLEKTSPGTLDLAAVDNVVESGFPLFARCYRDGVSRNSNLDGAVRLRFVVGNHGNVTVVEDGGSDLTDRQVVDCVAEGFYALRFPEPAKGDAHLIYRIHFDSG